MPIIIRDLITGRGETQPLGSTIATVATARIVLGSDKLRSQVDAVTILKADDGLADAHWEMYFHGNGFSVKIDLMQAGYRILYGAAPRPGRDAELDRITLNPAKTLQRLIEEISYVATSKGDWTGTAQYNCQDFVVAYMSRLGMSTSDIFRFELRRAATKLARANNTGIQVTDCITQGGQRYLRQRVAIAPILIPLPTD